MMNSIVYNRDCLEAMRLMPDKCFDLAIVDPPYGINVAKSGKVGCNNRGTAKNYGAKEWDNEAPKNEYFIQLMRVSKNQIVWGANHFISRMPYDSSCWLVWDKDNSGNFADCELAWCSFDTAVRKFSYRWNGMLQGNMKHKEHRIHPTQKPIAIYKWLFQNYAKPTDRILDTHLGSGSSRIAAYDAGLDFTGFEIDKEYFDAQELRFNKHISQQSLFEPNELVQFSLNNT